MVFGARLAERITAGFRGPSPSGVLRPLGGAAGSIALRELGPVRPLDRLRTDSAVSNDLPKLRDRLQRAMTAGAGVTRSAASLAGALAAVEEVASELDGAGGAAGAELANLVVVARAILASAAARAESRGAHTRSDYLETDPNWRCRLVQGDEPWMRGLVGSV
jgi:succinate dehydrogenase/fumarate reductase flavoprotein subunit